MFSQGVGNFAPVSLQFLNVLFDLLRISRYGSVGVFHHVFEGRLCQQGLAARPRFRRRSAPRGMDQADGDVFGTLQVASKEISDS